MTLSNIAKTSLLVLAIGLAGCSKSQPNPPEPTSTSKASAAATPRQAMVDFFRALDSGDKDAFLRTVYVGSAKPEAAAALDELTLATYAFSKDFEKAYGRDAGGGITMPILSDQELADVRVEQNGDQAVAQWGPRSMQLTRVGGTWQVDISSQLPADDATSFIAGARAMTARVKSAQAKIGKEGYTGAMVLAELASPSSPAAADQPASEPSHNDAPRATTLPAE